MSFLLGPGLLTGAMLVLGRVVTIGLRTTTQKRDLFVRLVNEYSCIVATSKYLGVPWTFKVAPELSMALLSQRRCDVC